MLFANIHVELVGSMPGIFLIPSIVTPYLTAVSPGTVHSQLPPWSIEMSTITEPGFIDFTISSVIITGASFEGTSAEQTMMSISLTTSLNASLSLRIISSLRAFA